MSCVICLFALSGEMLSDTVSSGGCGVGDGERDKTVRCNMVVPSSRARVRDPGARRLGLKEYLHFQQATLNTEKRKPIRSYRLKLAPANPPSRRPNNLHHNSQLPLIPRSIYQDKPARHNFHPPPPIVSRQRMPLPPPLLDNLPNVVRV